MRLLVFFDLPVVTKAERRAYTIFRRFLVNDGYDMIQFSVYGRILNGNDALEKHYGEEEEKGATLESEEGGQASEDLEHLRDMASEAPVIRLVNAMIAQAIEKRASDIHIEPFEKEFRIRFRVDGVLYNQEMPPRELKAAIISRLKLMAKLNIAERRLPQDGRIKIKILGREVDLRVSTLPTLYGESVVDLPLPVGPVTRKMPWGREVKCSMRASMRSSNPRRRKS